MTKLRELSHGEIAFHKGCLSIPVMSHIKGEFPLTIVQHYLDKWIETHPIIGCRVANTNSVLHFEDQGKRSHKIEEIHCEDEQAAEQCFEDVVNSIIKPDSLIDAYLFRVENSETSYFVTNLSHVISDGACNIEMHRYLLESVDRYLKSQSLENSCGQGNLYSSNDDNHIAPYPIEDYLVPRFDGLSTVDIVRQDVDFFARKNHSILSDKRPDNYDLATLPASKSMKVMSFEFNSADTRQVVTWCKSNNVSVNTALVTALIRTANQLLQNEDNHLLIRQAVNLREKVTPNIENDVFISSASSIVSSFSIMKKDPLESLSKQVSQITQKENEFAPTLQNHIANKEIFKVQKLPLAMHFSNLGRLNINTDYTHFKLRRFIVCPSANFGETIPLLLSTLGSRLTITVHANMHFFSEKLISKLIQKAMESFSTEVEKLQLAST